MTREQLYRLKVPIIIGITGHRDLRLEDIEPLKQILTKQIGDLKNRFQNTPFKLLSPLAEGADQLAVQVAIDMNIPFIVPLPLPLDVYQQDFTSQDSQEGFLNLLAQAEQSFELPLMAGSTLEDIRTKGVHRDRQYAQVGAYIAQHSQILFALWDGVETGFEGGASAVVDFKLSGIPEPFGPPRSSLDTIENCIVVHIVTPRCSNPTVNDPFSIHEMPQSFDEHIEFMQVLGKIVSYNDDVELLAEQMTTEIVKSKEYLVPPEVAKDLPSRENAMLDRYAASDMLAQYFQKKHYRTLVGLIYLLVSGIIALQVHLKFIHFPVLIIVFLLLYGLAYIWFRRFEKLNPQDKYLDYRALAEGLRIQFIWNLAGLNEEVSDRYLRKQKGELDWIRFAIRSFNIMAPDSQKPSSRQVADVKENYKLLLDRWVNGERDFFEDRSVRFRNSYKKFQRLTSLSFWVGIASAALSLLLSAFMPGNKSLFNPVTGFATIALSCATALRVYMEIKGFKENSIQYKRMLKHFNKASHDLSEHIRKNNYDEAQRLIRDLGKEALRENGDWLLLHRSRPISFSKMLFAPK